MSFLINASRLALFGVDMTKQKPSIEAVAKTLLFNRARRLIGLPDQAGPTWSDWTRHHAQNWFLSLLGLNHEDSLPAGFPRYVWETLDGVLKSRGGMSNKETQAPNYWLSRTAASTFPHMWEVQVDYSPSANINGVYAMEEMFEDALARRGYELNVRIVPKPLRIQIDRPDPVIQRLSDYWHFVANVDVFPVNKFYAAMAACWVNGEAGVFFLDLSDVSSFSMGVFSASGGGKTQFATALLLSACMMNSPEVMSLIILDPKVIDFGVVNGLPHLAVPVVNDVDECVNILRAVVAEMDRRTKLAKTDTSFVNRRIVIYVDEVHDLIMTGGDEVANMLQRIAQKGRGLGFSIILSSQRAVKGFPANILNNLATRLVGRMGNAWESAQATGVEGSTCHRLPGKGAFECYNQDYSRGQRIQSLFVGDSKSADYPKTVGWFIAEIKKRWGDAQPHWKPDMQEVQAASESVKPIEKPMIDPALVDALRVEYADDPESFSIRTVRRVHGYLFGREVNPNKAKAIFNQFMEGFATENAGD